MPSWEGGDVDAPVPTRRVYRCAWLSLLGLALLATAPVGYCLWQGFWPASMRVGHGWLQAAVAAGCLIYLFHLAAVRFRVTDEGLVAHDGIRLRLHPWRLVRSVRKDAHTLSLGRVLPLRIWHWDVTGRGGLVRCRVPSIVGRKFELFEIIEDRARAHRLRRIEAERKKRGKTLRRQARPNAEGAVGLGSLREGRDSVDSRRKQRWRLEPPVFEDVWGRHRVHILTVPREVGFVFLATLVSILVSVVWVGLA